MKPAPFEYHRPSAVAEALGLLAEYGDEAKPLAGGQSLVPILALRLGRFEHLVDLQDLSELATIEPTDGALRIGAMVRQRTAERDPIVRERVPLLHRALPWIAHFQIRNRGTVGGSIAHADPAAELPAVALALDATIELASKSGTRTVAASDFFEGPLVTTQRDDELLMAVSFPRWGAGSGFAITEFARRSGDFAVAGVACGLEARDGLVSRAAIAFFGMGSTPVRSRSTEAALVGTPVDELDPASVAADAVGETEPADDLHASASHRRRIAFHLATDALSVARAEAVGAAA